MKEDPRADPVEKDVYDDDTGVQMDVLLEEWERFLNETAQPFELIPRDFHGVLDEKILNNVKNSKWGGIVSYKAAIEGEYPDLKDLYAEQIYTRYNISLYNFFQMMGFPKKTDARAEVGENDKYFWDEFMKRVNQNAVENVWDLFDYQVALVYAHLYPLTFEKSEFRGKTVYTVVKDGAYRSFTGVPIVKEAAFLVGKIDNGRFDHEGQGFIAIFVNGSDIIKNLMDGHGSISANAVCIGIHDWTTGAGTVQMINKDLTMDLQASYVDDPNMGIMRHRPGMRARHDRKKVV